MLQQFGVGLILVACGAALVLGRWPERVAGATYLVAWRLSELLQDRTAHQKVQPALFAIDCGVALVLAALLVRTDRSWVEWAAAYGLLLVLTHVAAWCAPDVHRFDFFTAYYVWSEAQLVALGVGVVLERRRPVLRPGEG